MTGSNYRKGYNPPPPPPPPHPDPKLHPCLNECTGNKIKKVFNRGKQCLCRITCTSLSVTEQTEKFAVLSIIFFYFCVYCCGNVAFFLHCFSKNRTFPDRLPPTTTTTLRVISAGASVFVHLLVSAVGAERPPLQPTDLPDLLQPPHASSLDRQILNQSVREPLRRHCTCANRGARP